MNEPELAALIASVSTAYAQKPVAGIYTCIDSRGRKLTSDRPIAECTDREQSILNPSGTVKAKVGPTLTAQERAAQEEKDKLALEDFINECTVLMKQFKEKQRRKPLEINLTSWRWKKKPGSLRKSAVTGRCCCATRLVPCTTRNAPRR